MSLRNLIDRQTLAFRLTLRHVVIFALSLAGIFLACYLWLWFAVHELMYNRLADDLNEFKMVFASQGPALLEKSFQWKTEARGTGRQFYRLLDSKGDIRFASDMREWNGMAVDREALREAIDRREAVFRKEPVPRRRHRARVLYGEIAPGLYLEAGVAPKEMDIFLDLFERVFGIAILFFLLSASAAGWLVSRRALNNVEEVTRLAQNITGGTFDRRVPLPSKRPGAEIERLIKTFNGMLDRIQVLMKSLRETNDNIAHDLRGPLTRMRGWAEVTLTGRSSLDEYQTSAAKTVEECDRLLEMINTMLEISEAEAGAGRLNTEELDLARLAHEAVDLFLPVADDKQIAIGLQAPEPCLFLGDKQRLQRMLANLLDNALKYTPRGGKVLVAVEESGNRIRIRIEDTGCGIAASDLPHIFERFYRCDASRSQPGIGLGLSLSSAIARAHGGDIQVVSRLSQGSAFSIILPCFVNKIK